jgi:hypothetical protein
MGESNLVDGRSWESQVMAIFRKKCGYFNTETAKSGGDCRTVKCFCASIHAASDAFLERLRLSLNKLLILR